MSPWRFRGISICYECGGVVVNVENAQDGEKRKYRIVLLGDGDIRRDLIKPDSEDCCNGA